MGRVGLRSDGSWTRCENREAGCRDGIGGVVLVSWIRVRRAGSRSAGVDAGGVRDGEVRAVWCAVSRRRIAGSMVEAVV